MAVRRTRQFIVLFSIFFLASFQLASALHMAAYGSEHSHDDGIACVSDAVQGEEQAILPTSNGRAFLPAPTTVHLVHRQVPIAWGVPPGRAPPPRSPPTSFQ